MSQSSQRLIGLLLWTLLGGVYSLLVTPEDYSTLLPSDESSVRILIHDSAIPGNDGAYSWSYSWSSMDPRTIVNRVDDFYEVNLPHGNYFQTQTSKPTQARLHRYREENRRGWAATGRLGTDHTDVCTTGRRQSPIDINTSMLKFVQYQCPLRFYYYWDYPIRTTMNNTGETIQVVSEWPNGMQPSIWGGPLGGEYVFWQFHFHWGSDNSMGSEHTFDRKSFPMEMHVVHYKKEYGSPMDAMKRPDGLVVVGYIFQISEYDNPGLRPLVKKFEHVSSTEEEGLTVELKYLPLGVIAPPIQGGYVTYTGSLTVPPCSEVVTWILSPEILKISQQQMNAFRRIFTPKGLLVDNFREPQPLNGRVPKYVVV